MRNFHNEADLFFRTLVSRLLIVNGNVRGDMDSEVSLAITFYNFGLDLKGTDIGDKHSISIHCYVIIN